MSAGPREPQASDKNTSPGGFRIMVLPSRHFRHSYFTFLSSVHFTGAHAAQFPIKSITFTISYYVKVFFLYKNATKHTLLHACTYNYIPIIVVLLDESLCTAFLLFCSCRILSNFSVSHYHYNISSWYFSMFCYYTVAFSFIWCKQLDKTSFLFILSY